MARLTPLLFVLWVGVAVGAEVDLQKRVIGGRQCRPNERQYHVILIGENLSTGDSFFCGGSLISDRWVLTAAHCYEKGWKMSAILGWNAGQPQTLVIEAKPEIYKLKDVMKIERIHDIMLLKLPQTTQIQPVALPDCAHPPNIGDTVQIAGHAATRAGLNNRRISGSSRTLQCAEITVVDCQGLRKCLQTKHPAAYTAKRPQTWFCGQRCAVDACPGDSGGGVVFNDMIYGVISFTGDPEYACREAVGFMSVCGYLDWINGILTRPNTIGGKIKKLCDTCG